MGDTIGDKDVVSQVNPLFYSVQPRFGMIEVALNAA